MTRIKGLNWRNSQRPRERLLRLGAASLSPAELLAICLGPGVAGEDSVAMVHRLLRQFGSLERLLGARPERLMQQRGVGLARAASLAAINELHCRQDEHSLAQGQILHDVGAVARYLKRRIGHTEREVFGILFLDTRHCPIHWQEMFFGSLNRAHVSTREVLKRAMEVNAAALVLAHNHPSGVAEPSSADIHLTTELKDLLVRVDVQLLDHIVVAPGGYVSFAARGLIR